MNKIDLRIFNNNNNSHKLIQKAFLIGGQLNSSENS